jgi:hypothetical protein
MLSKALIDRFISKYHLGGVNETVEWTSDGYNLSVNHFNQADSLVVAISTRLISLPEGKFVIFETTQLRSLLGVLGEDIEFKVRQSAGVATSFTITDKMSKVAFALADPAVLNLKSATPKNHPEPEVSIILNKPFMDAFSKARGALSTIEQFAVMSDGTKTEVVLGYEEYNTTNVTIVADTNEADVMKPVFFSASIFKDILAANKEAKSGTFTVSEKGLGKIIFDVDGFTEVQYMIIQKTKA